MTFHLQLINCKIVEKVVVDIKTKVSIKSKKKDRILVLKVVPPL